MQYRIKYGLWTVQASSVFEAEQKAIKLLSENLASLVHCEQDVPDQSLMKRVFATGK